MEIQTNQLKDTAHIWLTVWSLSHGYSLNSWYAELENVEVKSTINETGFEYRKTNYVFTTYFERPEQAEDFAKWIDQYDELVPELNVDFGIPLVPVRYNPFKTIIDNMDFEPVVLINQKAISMIAWLHGTNQGKFFMHGDYIWFENAQDAMVFKMKL